jgi:hypothetical protein
MQGYGPVSGERIESNFILLSKDATIADVTCARLMGFNPNRIPYLSYACKKKGINIDSIEKPSPSLCRKYLFIPIWEYRIIREKIRVTRTTIRLNERGKRIVHIFLRLPSYIRERKLIPFLKHLKSRWDTLISGKRHIIEGG